MKKNLNKFQVFFFEYGRFHFDTVNIIIHIIFVPLIIISFDRIACILGERNGFPFNPFFVLYSITTCLYLYVDPISGIFSAIEFPLIGYLLTLVKFEIFGLTELQSYLLLNFVSWIAQFIGHGFAEKREEALADNIFLTLNTPCFVNIELFNMLIGYRKKELDEVRTYIIRDIAIYRKNTGLDKTD